MNTKIINAAIASLEVSSSIRKVYLQKGAAIAGHLLLGFIKFSMISAPFLSMVIMILALWGVVGKTTYTDLDAIQKKDIAFDTKEAKNYLVNETKNIKQCSEELKSPDIRPEREKLKPSKVDWEHIV
ncbi:MULTISPECIES: hypothetical protein [unclassified Methylobacter]|uniref:hypothetical protein n=1 Tax=unclassified Methylobacter TaxID=2635283 RepID=UPI001E474943|nr:hypothetical protein [Methylobacter sp. BlB1]